MKTMADNIESYEDMNNENHGIGARFISPCRSTGRRSGLINRAPILLGGWLVDTYGARVLA